MTQHLLLPPKLHPGDTVGLFSSGFRVLDDNLVQYAVERLEAIGLKVAVGDAVLQQRGYFAGDDIARARDINKMFADPNIKALFQLRGGWGSSRLLPLLDYDVIKKHPKIVMGLSDTTSLLLGIHSQTGLVTFHGPVASQPWLRFTAETMQTLFFEGRGTRYHNPNHSEEDLTQTRDRFQTIIPGTAKGRLLGGNLTVLTTIIGSPYLPNWDGAILFVEEIGEEIYRIDRMFTQLKLAGILDKLAGIIIGKFTHCNASNPGSRNGSLRLSEVLLDHIRPLGIPAWQGAMIGHENYNFILPIGMMAEIDANSGLIAFPAVTS